MIDRDEAHRLHEVLMDAMERELAANSDEARAEAQAAVLAADAALARANGTADLRRRRMMVDARALPSGAKVEAADFARFARDCLDGTPGGQIRLRQALARHATDWASVLTKDWAGVHASQLGQNAKGHNGPLDGPVRAGGVDPDAGAADELRNKIVVDAGYTIGVEAGPAGRVRHPMWKRAERAQHALAARLRMSGQKAGNATAATIKDWCQKDGPLAALFRDARGEGAAARAAPDPTRILPV
jgi:hypothetical protein